MQIIVIIYFVQQYFLRVIKMSQREMKENPRKRLRVPPNSATKEETGKISSSVSTLVSLETAQSENKKWSDSKADGYGSPMKLYFLYLHGFVQPVL